MSGVWKFKNGVVRLVENPANEQSSTMKRKVLLHTPTNEVISSYASLERKLIGLGWERYYEDPDLLQFHKRSSIDLISLPLVVGKTASKNGGWGCFPQHKPYQFLCAAKFFVCAVSLPACWYALKIWDWRW